MGDQKLEHLFDGFAIIHRYVIRDGEVQYQTRILDTDTWVRSCKANRLAVTQFGTYAYPDLCKGTLDKYGTIINTAATTTAAAVAVAAATPAAAATTTTTTTTTSTTTTTTPAADAAAATATTTTTTTTITTTTTTTTITTTLQHTSLLIKSRGAKLLLHYNRFFL